MRFNQIHNHPAHKKFRKDLRNNLQPAEAELWKYLKGRQMEGRKFRRQHSIEKFVLDFYCPAEKLAIELDGESHNNPNRQQYDAKRTRFLNQLGIKVLRFENRQVFEDLQSVLDCICDAFDDRKRRWA